ncbi:MAG: phytanoyl-CoA dioxygenase family protein, partial [Planctomycetes bacterium]|nr:phytanoyl-CoA dioxygenase family protein [Planctomycetota bacterium]
MDLARCHRPVSDFLRLPDSREEWEQYRLTEEQVGFYRENGYLGGVRILDERQLERLRDEVEEFVRPDHPGRELWYEYYANESTDPETVLFHALGAWRLRPAFHDVLWHPAFTVPAAQLLGGAVRFWHDQVFYKPARHGGVVSWHQDYSYWTRTTPMAHLTCWIGLDDSARENGCVHYVPGSHRWHLLPITGLAGDMEAIRDVLSDEQWQTFQQ